MTKHEITYGGHKITYILTRKNVKNINLNLKPDLSVEVSASEKVSLESINKFVKRKASWILKNKEYFKKSQPEIKYDREYVSGEAYKHLGRQYRLKVIGSKKELVKCHKGFLTLYVQNKKDQKRKEQLMEDWYKTRATIVFNESLDRMYKIIGKYNIEKPKIIIRLTRARWGSCTENKKTILLNFDLINAPKFCIDYVVLHELIHFKYRTHDKKFYNLMGALMPDWKRRKEILDIEVIKNL